MLSILKIKNIIYHQRIVKMHGTLYWLTIFDQKAVIIRTILSMYKRPIAILTVYKRLLDILTVYKKCF
jgi:hypothetical protein